MINKQTSILNFDKVKQQATIEQAESGKNKIDVEGYMVLIRNCNWDINFYSEMLSCHKTN